MVIEVAPAPTLALGPGGVGGCAAFLGPPPEHPHTVAAAAMATVMKIGRRIRKLDLAGIFVY